MGVRRWTTFTATGVAVTLAVAQLAPGAAGAGKPESPGPLKIGTVLPATGVLSFLGPPTIAGADLAVEDINAAGGVFGQPVELTQGDSGTDPVVANATVDGYLADDTQIIVGAVSSGISRTIIDKIVNAGRIQISPSNTSPAFTNYPDDGLYFRTSPSDVVQGTVLAEQIAAESSTATVAFRADEYGDGISSTFALAFESLTGNAPTLIPYSFADFPFDTTAAQVAAADADALLLVGFDETELILRKLDDLGIGPVQGENVWGVDGNIGDALGVVAADVVDGMRGVLPDFVRDPAFVARLADLGVGEMIYAGETYDAVVIAALAAVIAGSDDPVQIAAEMVGVTRHGQSCSSFADCAALIDDGVNIDYSGFGGEYEFDNCGETTVANMLVYEFEFEAEFPGISSLVVVDELTGVPSIPLSGPLACAQPDTLSDVLDSIIPQGGPGSHGLYTKIEKGNYKAFIKQVEAKCCLPKPGKLLTRQEADQLIALATDLL